jgi:hypothetical protein
MPHLYTIELRFSSPSLEVSSITNKLNLQPSNFLTFEQASKSKKKRNPYWGYNGFGEVDFNDEWVSLEEGLVFLLKTITHKKADIIMLASEFQAVWWCGHFQNIFSGGPTISANLLAELSSYGIPLYIDNYFGSE